MRDPVLNTPQAAVNRKRSGFGKIRRKGRDDDKPDYWDKAEPTHFEEVVKFILFEGELVRVTVKVYEPAWKHIETSEPIRAFGTGRRVGIPSFNNDQVPE